MRGEDARYVDNNGDDDQANTRLRGSFFFSLSLLSVPPSRVTLLVTVRLFCANFLFSPPLPLFSSSFFQKKTSPSTARPVLKRVARFYPIQVCTERLSPARKNVKHPFTSVTSPGCRVSFPFVSFTLPRDPVYLSVSKDTAGYAVTTVQTKRFRERSLSLSQIVDPMFTSVEIKESSGVTRFLLPLFLFLPISTIPKRVFSSFLLLTDSNRVRENKLSDTAER